MLGVAGVWLGRFWSCFKTAQHEHTPCGVPLLITLLLKTLRMQFPIYAVGFIHCDPDTLDQIAGREGATLLR